MPLLCRGSGSVPVTFIVGECAHYSEGVAADRGGLRRVGSQLAWKDSAVSV